ncbi:dihydrofolate reductase family protein [Herbidospora mongoliensis]|uniref:dihydrofolate reductase family protein n=1 Tax=Herbidospora mongoliensis TaxID=688067 RepID=UPI000829D53D|nr:dihydrofolate reductase family protein [Herbidospora mongoliensis]
MRKLIYIVNTSLDGYIDGPGGAFDWTTVGPEFSAFSEGLTDETDILLYGRVVYGWMSSYWPTADQEEGAHPHDVAYAPKWRARPKVVVSDTLTEVPDDTRIIRGASLEADLTALKHEEGGHILLTGGNALASTLVGLGLVDEIVMVVHPVVLTGGTPLLSGVKDRLRLGLLESRTCDDTVIISRYAPAAP